MDYFFEKKKMLPFLHEYQLKESLGILSLQLNVEDIVFLPCVIVQ